MVTALDCLNVHGVDQTCRTMRVITGDRIHPVSARNREPAAMTAAAMGDPGYRRGARGRRWPL